MQTAVLYCVFNRLDTVKETFAPIREAKPPRFYLAVDGPRTNKEGEAELVNQVKNYILENIDWDCEVKTLIREVNLGCDKAISEAISWFFSHEEMGIIMEDDIKAGKTFFEFCEKMLIKYKDDPRVRSICPIPVYSDESYKYDYVFKEHSTTWGWATWKRAWEGFDPDIKKWDDYRASLMLNKVYDREDMILKWTRIFDECRRFNHTPWDYAFSFHNFQFVPEGCYSICTSKKVLLTNIGYEGVHYNKDTSDILGWEVQEIDMNNLSEPPDVELDKEYLNKAHDNALRDEFKNFENKNMFLKFTYMTKLFLITYAAFLKKMLALNEKSRQRRLYKYRYLKDNLDKHIFYIQWSKKNKTI